MNKTPHLVDFLDNNLLIAHYCGFDITSPLPSYWTFDRFLKNSDNSVFSDIMKAQVNFLALKGIVNTSFIGLDSTPVVANTSQNNPNPFCRTPVSHMQGVTLLIPSRQWARGIKKLSYLRLSGKMKP